MNDIATDKPVVTHHECNESLSAIEDSLYAIGGKWKLKIISALRDDGRSKRFNELQRMVTGISARVLSNELKELEMNGIVKRQVYTEVPVVIVYELTEYSETLGGILAELVDWGKKHRQRIRGRE